MKFNFPKVRNLRRFLLKPIEKIMKKMNDKNISHYKNLSNYWDITDGTIGIEELEEIAIEADQNIKSYVLSYQELILYLQGLLDLKQVQ